LAFVVFFLVFPLYAAVAAAESLYLAGTGVPEASLSVQPPSAGTLPNYDPGRDDSPGLVLKKTDEGANEADPTKYQIWVAPSAGAVLDGNASFTFWSAMKDFDESKKGEVEAYLLECAPSGSDCTTIDSGSVLRGQWRTGSSAWVSRTIQFGSVSHAVPAGRSLAVKVVVGDHSDDDVWFAYGVANYPSLLTVTPAAADNHNHHRAADNHNHHRAADNHNHHRAADNHNHHRAADNHNHRRALRRGVRCFGRPTIE
jgi:hypothetical protein